MFVLQSSTNRLLVNFHSLIGQDLQGRESQYLHHSGCVQSSVSTTPFDSKIIFQTSSFGLYQGYWALHECSLQAVVIYGWTSIEFYQVRSYLLNLNPLLNWSQIWLSILAITKIRLRCESVCKQKEQGEGKILQEIHQ